MSNIKQKVILGFKDDTFVEQLKALLLKTGKVKIRNLGIFEIGKIGQRNGYNVGKGGGKIVIKAHNRLKFRPTKNIKQAIQSYEGN